MMTVQTPRASALACGIVAATGLFAAASSFAAIVFFPSDTLVTWSVIAIAGGAGSLAGAVAAWTSRFRRPAPALIGGGFSLTGLLLIAAALTNVWDQASGGSNSLGGGLLLFFAAALVAPACVGAIALSVTIGRRLKPHP